MYKRQGEVHCSILADVVVITCSVKSTPTVLHLQVIRGERTVGTGGGTVDHKNQTITAQPGALLIDIQAAAKEEGLFYPPDPGEKTASILSLIHI